MTNCFKQLIGRPKNTRCATYAWWGFDPDLVTWDASELRSRLAIGCADNRMFMVEKDQVRHTVFSKGHSIECAAFGCWGQAMHRDLCIASVIQVVHLSEFAAEIGPQEAQIAAHELWAANVESNAFEGLTTDMEAALQASFAQAHPDAGSSNTYWPTKCVQQPMLPKIE